jgi:hypothetical protein
VEIDLHFVRERVALGAVRVLHVPTRMQFADVFTKGLPSSVFSDFRSSLNVRSIDVPTAGGGVRVNSLSTVSPSCLCLFKAGWPFGLLVFPL